MPGFPENLVETEGDSQDRVIARETAIPAVVNALVRQVERRKQAHGAAEIPGRQRARSLRELLKLSIGGGLEEASEALEHGRSSQRQGIQNLTERHSQKLL
jgi:hypothetical protein